MNKFRQFQKKVNKFYYSEDKKDKNDYYRNDNNFDDDLNYLTMEDKETRNKINMTIVKNNLSLSNRNINKNELNSESNTYKDENSNIDNYLQNSLPSYNEFLKGNIKNNNSAPTAKYNK